MKSTISSEDLINDVDIKLASLLCDEGLQPPVTLFSWSPNKVRGYSKMEASSLLILSDIIKSSNLFVIL
jgi:hypothetical protein